VEPSPTISGDQPNTDEAVLEDNVIETDGDEGDETTAEQAWMDGLNLSTAIRLRWVLRDIKAKRTKLFPVSPDDLKRLTELGLIETYDDEPTLTKEGMKVIDRT
jgi:hypothetical protein